VAQITVAAREEQHVRGCSRNERAAGLGGPPVSENTTAEDSAANRDANSVSTAGVSRAVTQYRRVRWSTLIVAGLAGFL
jgi:hypothetical protein